MAGNISELRVQKRARDRVNVYIEGRFAFALPDMEAARLRVGQYLGDDDIARLQGLDAGQRAYDRAVRFLSYRPRSEAEVRANLARAAIDEALVEQVVTRLREQGYLNDAEFARFWIGNRERFRPRGERALREELRRKGVSDADSAPLLSDLDASESAYRAAYPTANRLAPLLKTDRQVFRRKVGDFLLRRGYDYSTARDVVARLERELAPDEMDE